MATVVEMPEVELEEVAVEATPRIDRDGLYEVVDGKIVVKKVGAREIRIAGKLGRLLGNHVEDRGLGKVDVEMIFQLDPASRRKRRPDVAFVSAGRWPLDRPVPDAEAWMVAPDLAVEVISPTELAVDMVAKVREYFENGVGRVWLVFPGEKRIYDYATPDEIRVIGIAGAIDGGDLIPGLHLPLSALFQEA